MAQDRLLYALVLRPHCYEETTRYVWLQHHWHRESIYAGWFCHLHILHAEILHNPNPSLNIFSFLIPRHQLYAIIHGPTSLTTTGLAHDLNVPVSTLERTYGIRKHTGRESSRVGSARSIGGNARLRDSVDFSSRFVWKWRCSESGGKEPEDVAWQLRSIKIISLILITGVKDAHRENFILTLWCYWLPS